MSYKRLTTSCIQCKREISSNNLQKHIDSKSCKNIRDEVNIVEYAICSFCQGQFERLTSHQKYCHANPDRKSRNNQFTKAKQEGRIVEVSKETRSKLSIASTGSKHSEETKRIISDKMRKIAAEKPGSYSGGYNRGRVKTMVCSNGFTVIGSWERDFVEFCVEKRILIEQPNIGFSYVFGGERTYYPDFYLPDLDLYVEIKGYQTDKDLTKWNFMRVVHKKRLVVVRVTDIKCLNSWWDRTDSNRYLRDYESRVLTN